ncbi:MAG: leucyl aminopeptidase [Candidatus Nanopelagicales bacterium]
MNAIGVSRKAEFSLAATLNLDIELVSLDDLQSLAEPLPLDHEDASQLVASDQIPPPGIFVVESTPGTNDVVAGVVGVEFAALYQIDLDRRLRRASAKGEPGEVVEVVLEDDVTESLLVLGTGTGSPKDARQAGASLAKWIKPGKTLLCGATAPLSKPALRAFCEGLFLASYKFSRKSVPADADEPEIAHVQLAVASPANSAATVAQAKVTAEAVLRARELANRPSNEKSPEFLVEQAQKVAKSGDLKITVFDQQILERRKFGGILAVGQGSAHEPRFISLEHKGSAGAPHVVLVGKGITFDSGGLSLKPADGMPLMKTDMSGAAVVLSVMSALKASGITTRVTGLLACAENMPSGSAYRPGDVITHYGGRTSEVFNTDAEGRLVLADALAYADEKLSPDVVVDVATLTGAATLGLSRYRGAIFANDDGLARKLEEAGEAGNERLWRLPLVEDYRPSLDSKIADISHVSDGSFNGGAITAALFLREFVGDHMWAHLDIAGPARSEAPRGEFQKGATGFGVRVLLRWLEQSPKLF